MADRPWCTKRAGTRPVHGSPLTRAPGHALLRQLSDCTDWGNALQKDGKIVGFACMENQGGKTYELTPYYAN